MHDRTWRGITAGLAVVVAFALLTSCAGGADDPVEVGAGAPAATPEDQAPPPSDGDASAATEAAPPADAPSPVEGLTADELRRAVDAPSSAAATSRRRSGPVAEPLVVDGRTLWRLTVPGRFQMLSSAIVVAVGGTDVGEGIVADDLSSLTVVTADPAPLVAGADVTYRWGAGRPTAAGALAVVR